MTNFFKNIARATASAIAVASFAVQAAPVQASVQTNWQEHTHMVEAVLNHGVRIEINPAECFEGERQFLGFYQGRMRRIVICQRAALAQDQPVIGHIYGWHADDLDTLRHETQHFIQDCVLNGRHDHQLAPVYQEPVKYGLYVLGEQDVQNIIEVYREAGASDHVLILEIEAFAVAAENEPLVQAEDVRRYCGANGYSA